jgi:hypothetical protein
MTEVLPIANSSLECTIADGRDYLAEIRDAQVAQAVALGYNDRQILSSAQGCDGVDSAGSALSPPDQPPIPIKSGEQQTVQCFYCKEKLGYGAKCDHAIHTLRPEPDEGVHGGKVLRGWVACLRTGCETLIRSASYSYYKSHTNAESGVCGEAAKDDQRHQKAKFEACKICSSSCPHGRHMGKCTECGGGSVCPHGRYTFAGAPRP